MRQIVPNLPGEFLGSDTLGIAGEFVSRRTAERMCFSIFPRQSQWWMAMGLQVDDGNWLRIRDAAKPLGKSSTRTDINSHALRRTWVAARARAFLAWIIHDFAGEKRKGALKE
jgi:hypothetical protein